jgi:predicted neuraminidase
MIGCLLVSALLVGFGVQAASAERELASSTARFDQLIIPAVEAALCQPGTNLGGNIAWGQGYQFAALVEMFDVTRDPKYAELAVKLGDWIAEARDNRHNLRDEVRDRVLPGWSSTGYSEGKRYVWAVHTGVIVAPMAQFAAVVRSDPGLAARWGKAADRLLRVAEEAVAIHDTEYRQGPAPDEGYVYCPYLKKPLPLNMQNALAAAWLAIDDATKTPKHRPQVERLARFMKNRLRPMGDGSYTWAYWPPLEGPETSSEDISHAAWNADFMVRCFEHELVFDRADLARLERTLSVRVLLADDRICDTVGGEGKCNTYRSAVLRWARLARHFPAVRERLQQMSRLPEFADDSSSLPFGLACLSLSSTASNQAAAAVPSPPEKGSAASTATSCESEFLFPLHSQHNHAPGIVECPNGDLLVSWYRGSGEREADDVAVYGARMRKGAKQWGEAFLLVDTPGFPDGNTALHIDQKGRLWLFWSVVIANTWESCLTQYRISNNYEGDGPPQWNWQGTIFLKPLDFERKMREGLEEKLKTTGQPQEGSARAERLERLKTRIEDKLASRLGWQVRCKPTVLPSGRILLPLYSDTYSAGIMAISDDDGKTWYASEPLAGFGSIQPSVLRRNDGTLVAYMRENGPLKKIRIAESRDDGLKWGAVGVTDLPNPGSGLDGVRLRNGHWVLVYNDTTSKRSSLAVSVSEDEGHTWKWTRHLEQESAGSYHYPAVIQARDGRIHVAYSYFVKGGQTMKHAAFSEEWVR